MKKFNKVSIGLVSLVLGLALPVSIFAATTPTLGGVSNFSVLGSTYSNVAGTSINGDVGYTTPPAVNPAVSGTTHVADAPYNQAGTDQGTLLGNLNSQSCNYNFGSPTDLSLLPQPLVPGVYCITAATSIGTAGITLSGSGTYIFRIAGALTSVANSNVALSGGASACNIFWTPSSATTLGANSTFSGTNIDPAGITIGSTVSWIGRALAFGGTVTTNTDTISMPSCGSSTTTTTTTTTTTSTPTLTPPIISITKVPTLVSTFTGGGLIQYDYTVTNIGPVAISNVAVVDNKCFPIAFISGDLNGNLQLEGYESWHYRCSQNISQTTTNVATATGQANGFTATATANATVVVNQAVPVVAPVVTPAPIITPVVTPTLPKTGFPPKQNLIEQNIWSTIQNLFSFLF